MEWEIGVNDSKNAISVIITDNEKFKIRVSQNNLDWILRNRLELIAALNSIDVIIDRLIDIHIIDGVKNSE